MSFLFQRNSPGFGATAVAFVYIERNVSILNAVDGLVKPSRKVVRHAPYTRCETRLEV